MLGWLQIWNSCHTCTVILKTRLILRWVHILKSDRINHYGLFACSSFELSSFTLVKQSICRKIKLSCFWNYFKHVGSDIKSWQFRRGISLVQRSNTDLHPAMDTRCTQRKSFTSRYGELSSWCIEQRETVIFSVSRC